MKRNNPKAPTRRDKIYIPKRGNNPEQFSKRIFLLNEKIEKNNILAEMKETGLYNYINLMTNFACHDLKNAVHSLDGYVNTLDENTFSKENVDVINNHIANLRHTIENFRTLAPDKSRSNFTLYDLGLSVELLNRGLANNNGVIINFFYDKSDKTSINQSLHNIIQILNNLINNSVRALSETKEKKINIYFYIKEDTLIIKVFDNGRGIKDNIIDKIFDLHFTTTPNGSGIGLYHAKFILEDIGGTINYERGLDEFITCFILKIPIYEQSIDINN